MAKYKHKELDKKSYTTKKVTGKVHVTIKTAYGDVLVEPGNYIITDELGNQFGITQQDLDAHYKPARK